MSRPGKGNKAPIFCCSPLPSPPPPNSAPPGPGRAGCKFPFFPQPLGFQHNFRRRSRQPRGGGWDGRGEGARWACGDSLGRRGGGGGWDPSPPVHPWSAPAGDSRPGCTFCPPPGPPPATPPGLRALGAGRCLSPGVTKGLRASLPRVPLPRPPPSCLSAGSQVITNPWRGAEAEHLPERHGDDE